jgi:RND family efflux transporter MFP subunit
MKMIPWLVTGVSLVALIACRPSAPYSQSAPPSKQPESTRKEGPASDSSFLEVKGRTQCVPGRKGTIAPVPLHPVVEVLVVPGQCVKKDQPLVKIDDDEPQAEVRAKKATLESARITLKESRRLRAAAERVYQRGAMADVTYYTIRTTAAKAEQEALAAEAALAAAQAELEHYVVTAGVAGVVSWLDVHPGMVSRPGTTVWGEILDLSEIDVRCELTPEQVERVTLGLAAAVRLPGKAEVCAAGKVVFVGIAADRVSGLVPVLVRVSNAKGRLRCEVPVQVRFPNLPAGDK